MTNFDAVGAFHKKFGLPSVTHDGPQPRLIETNAAVFRLKFLLEELGELVDAVDGDNLPGIADALIDIVYVALGTAHMYGLPWEELFNEVQRTNMLKERALDHPILPDQTGGDCRCGEPAWRHSKRGSALDIVKPAGWRPPELAAIIEAAKADQC